MPAVRPCAAFEPISPDIDVHSLVESTPNFEYVVRINCDMIDHQGVENFEKLVLLHVILGGKPLVVEGYQERLDRWTFALQWLKDNCSTKVESARDLTKMSQLPLSIGHYLNNMAVLTNQWTSKNYKDVKRQRIYLKDIDCPPLWHEKVKEILPLGLFYLNDTTGDLDGVGASVVPDSCGGTKKGRGIAKAGDLMSSLPPEMRAENLMCYIGHEGTYTPSHREMCASLGQNIMVETSTGANEDGKPTKPGSSIWFMTESKDRHLVAEYWLNTLGHDIEIEDHFAQINAWKAAPFKTYIVQQRVGDLILIPPLAPHQVWNRGTRTMKVAWNRTTVETLEMALNEALPRARMVCRDEQYKNKAIVYFTCRKYSRLLAAAEKLMQKKSKKKSDRSEAKIRQLQKDFRRLHALYSRILVSEAFFSNAEEREEKGVEFIEYDSFITCSYCRCNIFNRFLTCPSCIGEAADGSEDTYDICMECYAMGRSCACISRLRWVEQFKWSDLTHQHEAWRLQITQYEGRVTEKSPLRLATEILRFGRSTLAHICQMELERRPWNDITKPTPPETRRTGNVETVVDDSGNVTKKKIRRSEKWEREHKACHLCKWKEPTWKQAECSECGVSFCYGSLFRGFEIMPQDILENKRWICPKCQMICPCRDCMKRPNNEPYEPSTTIPGWDTKKIADPRSVQSLVDFGQSNMNWLKKAGDDHPRETRRLEKRVRAAEADKARDARADMVPEHYDNVDQNLLRLAEQEGIQTNGKVPIDPQLGTETPHLSESDESLSVNEDPEFPSSREYTNRGSPPPQFVVPAGGVVRDADHAYEASDAITFDYPDPEFSVPLAPLPEQSNPVEEVPPGYEAAYTEADQHQNGDTSGHIEMINHKRKRKSESGSSRKKSKAYLPEAANRSPKPLKPSRALTGIKKVRSRTDTRTIDGKPTLLVRLPVEKQRLEDLSKRLADMGPTTNGTEVEAPKIGSDLRALNVTGPEVVDDGSARKIRVEREEVDEDFAPSRRRDRRKDRTIPLQESIGVAPTRRARTKQVEYEDPSDLEDLDDNFTAEEWQAQQRDRSKSKWLEIRRRNDNETGQDVASSAANNGSRGQYTSSTSGGVDDMEGIAAAALASAARQEHNLVSPSQQNKSSLINGSGGASATKSRSLKTTNPSLIQKNNSVATAAAAANINRRAKLAAAQWAEGNDYDSLESYSSSDSEEDPGPAIMTAATGTPPKSSLRPKGAAPRPRPGMAKEVKKLTSSASKTSSHRRGNKARIEYETDGSADQRSASVSLSGHWTSMN